MIDYDCTKFQKTIDTIILKRMTLHRTKNEKERGRGVAMHLLALQIGSPKISFFAGAFFSIGHGHTQQAPRIQGRAIAEVHHVIEGGLATSNGQWPVGRDLGIPHPW